MKERKCSDCAKNGTQRCPSKGASFKEVHGGSLCLNRKDKPYFQPKVEYKSQTEKQRGYTELFRDDFHMNDVNGNSRGMHLVKCPICHEVLNIITSIHLSKHNITLEDFIKLDKDYIRLTGVQTRYLNQVQKEAPEYLTPEKERVLIKKRLYAQEHYSKNAEKIRLKNREQARLMRARKKEIAKRRKEEIGQLTPKFSIGSEITWSYYNRLHKGIVADYDESYYLVENITYKVGHDWLPKSGIKLIRW